MTQIIKRPDMEQLLNFLAKNPATPEANSKFQFYLNGIVEDLERSSVTIKEGEKISLFALFIDTIQNPNNSAEFIILGADQKVPHFKTHLKNLVEIIIKKANKKPIEYFDEGLIPDLIPILQKYSFEIDYINYKMKKYSPLAKNSSPLPPNLKWVPYCDSLAKKYYDHIIESFKGIKGANTLPFEQSKKRLEMQKGKEFINILVNEKSEIIGNFNVGKNIEDENFGDIKTIARNPKYKGKGIGKILLESAILFLHEKGFKQFSLEVNANNEKALSLYTQLEFKTYKYYSAYLKKIF